jgi:hypothetical protein
MRLRITLWLTVIVLCTPLVLAAWIPNVFTNGLRFVLRYNLELALPIFTHLHCLWRAYISRSGVLGLPFFLICCVVSIGAFAGLFEIFTALSFYIVTSVPALYVICGNLLSSKVRVSRGRA